MNKVYRVVPPLTGLQPASVLMDRIYTEMPAEQPDHPTCYEGEWVCDHTLCPVRAVRMRVKAHFYKHLPRLRCPLCLRTLDFRHWLNVIALREVPAEPPSAVVLAPCVKRGVRKKHKRSTGANGTSSA